MDDQQFSREHLARLRDLAASIDNQAVAHESALAKVLRDAGLGNDASMHLRREARELSAATARMVAELGDRQDRGTMLRSRPHGVLVVDDYTDSRESLALVMRNAGFIVRTANNGLDALIAAYEMHPSVIVMDMMMPVLDGIEATRLIKAIEELRHACVIAYTAMPALDAEAFAPLFSEVVRKPASPDVILAAVHRFLPA
jgi:CheY-like chemotaxis protein